jgi:hypothetical protein
MLTTPALKAGMLSFWQTLVTVSVLGILRLARTAPGAQNHIETFDRDVCVIGGGSSGTYTAIRLQQMGMTVALIEKSDLLGGQVNTYIDNITGKAIDYGVKVFNNVSVVRDYFDFLGVPLKKFESYVPDQKTIYANLANATEVSAAEISTLNVTDGLLRYQAQLEKYPYLSNGFHLPSPVPDDLLIPWGDFIEKHNLSAISGLVFTLVGGPGNILAQPTLYVAKNFGEIQVRSALEGLTLTEADGDNQALYTAALARLGNGTNTFVRSNVTHVVRNANGTEVTVSTPAGLKLIRASKLVITVPPELSILDSFLNLSFSERNLFRQFNNSYIWASIVEKTGIPCDTGLANVNPSATLGIPSMPAIFGTEPSGVSELLIVWYGSSFSMSDQQVKANILRTLKRWKMAMGYPTSNGTGPQIVQFKAHSPYMLTVSTEAIIGGFYDRLNALQGQHNTFWTGAAWQTQDSTALWNFTEHEILPMVMAALR